jgi:hypothetical protein
MSKKSEELKGAVESGRVKLSKEGRFAVTRGAMLQRLARRLSKRGERLVKVRQPGAGSYHTVDLSQGCVTGRIVDPEAYARELGVLNPWECVKGE